jgi:Kdo2-lipid IVA lauroyltransferase/acyltransferase
MYRLLTALGRGLCRLSPTGLERWAQVLAVLSFDVFRFRRRLILHNLAIAFGSEKSAAERRQLGRASMKHFYLTVFEFLRAVDSEVLEGLEAEGVAIVQAALAEGAGAYLLICHLGNWEVMAGAGARFAAPTHALVKEISGGGANRLVDELRRKIGWTPIYRKPEGSALRAIRAALKRNELVAFMLDQARPGAPRIPFFGTPAKTLTSLAAIWRKYPAPIIPVSITRLAPTRHRVKAWPPLDVRNTDAPKADVLAVTAACNRQLETMIRITPEQYFWLHNRWKD